MKFDAIGENEKKSRRGLLQMGWRSAAAVLALGSSRIQAAASPHGRVLVNLQLIGGNDSNNMIIPLEDGAYARYRSARGPLAIAREQALPVVAPRSNGARFGFHPAFVQLHDLYQRKALAVVANVGQASSAGLTHLTSEVSYVKGGYLTPTWAAELMGMKGHLAIEGRTLTFASGNTLISPSATAAQQSRFRMAMNNRVIPTAFPETVLGRNLHQVAQMISAAPLSGVSNPVILATRSGFDTHVNELAAQNKLFAEMDAALGAFERAMEDIGMAGLVTLYTQTEFNRTLVDNGKGGAEHAWGGHQLVMGHSVLGGDLYGTFPSLQVGGAEDAAGNGTWIPTTSNEQYHYTLAKWLGVGPAKASAVFPVASASPLGDLGFLV